MADNNQERRLPPMMAEAEIREWRRRLNIEYRTAVERDDYSRGSPEIRELKTQIAVLSCVLGDAVPAHILTPEAVRGG